MNVDDLLDDLFTEFDIKPEQAAPIALPTFHPDLPGFTNHTTGEEHTRQREFVESTTKRKIARAGRRGGKTIGVSRIAAEAFMAGKRVLYATPTQEQIDTFWTAICLIFMQDIENGILYKNETRHVLEVKGTKTRIRAKTAWNADTLRGDYADLLILDEYQLMNEDAWGIVGAPMLIDNNGDAVFIYTPPSLHSRSTSKATDPQHAPKLFKAAAQDTSGRWQTFHWSSYDNPFISDDALSNLTGDMTSTAIRQEIEALDLDEAPGALWKRMTIDNSRHRGPLPDFDYIVVGVDPSASSTGDECGIVAAGRWHPPDSEKPHFYPLEDVSVQGSPATWANAAVNLAYKWGANCIVAEANNGGEMVELTIKTVDANVRVELVHASRGKQTRAEPIASIYEDNRGHHCGTFALMEDEMVQWTPGDASPNRMDALVWAGTKLMLGPNNALRQLPHTGLWKPKDMPVAAPHGPGSHREAVHIRGNNRGRY